MISPRLRDRRGDLLERLGQVGRPALRLALEHRHQPAQVARAGAAPAGTR